MAVDQLWATQLLRRFPKSSFFIAPGSRCTPFTVALARQVSDDPTCHVVKHFDERGLAFACLGFAKATGVPGVFICTSGTAVANALPAVIEAHYTETPMVLLTADRPPELLNCGANQAIRQEGIFGDYVSTFIQLPVPVEEVKLDDLLAGLDFFTGPVHINCPFREPFGLELDATENGLVDDVQPAQPQPDVSRFKLTQSSTLEPVPLLGRILMTIGAGGISSDETSQIIERASEIGIPVLCDPLAPLSPRASDLSLSLPPFQQYDWALGHPATASRLAPETWLHLGGRLLSKRLENFAATVRPARCIHLSDSRQPYDPHHLFSETASVQACQALLTEAEPCSEYLQQWSEALQPIAKVVEAGLATHEFSDAVVLHEVTAQPRNIFIGNSMPVRDLLRFGHRHPLPHRVISNRGASGIDGLIATAFGAANPCGPLVLVLGDLSALHDLNSLALLRQAKHSILVIVINNDGGGIFHHLPIAKNEAVFEEWFATPHGLDFKGAAAQFGLSYQRVDSQAGLHSVLTDWDASPQTQLIEVITNRQTNLELHQRVQNRVNEKLEGLL